MKGNEDSLRKLECGRRKDECRSTPWLLMVPLQRGEKQSLDVDFVAVVSLVKVMDDIFRLVSQHAN